ncbi:autotransporter outer membrane beta-barrel domain-containing protein [Pseudomonas sp. B21-012]|uniref:autotransporter outer membrane beta-barrel domain-containing protein n=1 Tax=Pseudomonas sp. B21-012 TaxID=2895472 RepID=UPI00216014CC|nr:autotransporter outer membrane beta-barrel domain-containing protein [Pseudomonas sp. B21-012]UVM54892.1 autotransporter outer membrane beta-barrel domain-containing protein [Pseudomonas sp. B21-012]
MKTTPRTSQPRNRTIKAISTLPFLLLADTALAIVIEGPYTVDAQHTLTRFDLRPGAQLTVQKGARTLNIAADQAAMSLTGASVTATVGTGVRLLDSQAEITQSRIVSNDGVGLQLVRDLNSGNHSVARVSDSQVSGTNAGAWVTARSELYLQGSQVKASDSNGWGVLLLNGQLQARDSLIEGGGIGVLIANENAGQQGVGGLVDLDGTRVVGEDAAAIEVRSAQAQIRVANGSTLHGGNGNLLEVTEGGSATVEVSHSELLGDVQVGDASNLKLTLDQAKMQGDVRVDGLGEASVSLINSAQLRGNLHNVQALNIASQANWIMDGSNQVAALNLDGGQVSFGDSGAFHQLDVGTLTGQGTFHMAVDFATGEGDRLNVTGEAKGEHSLAIKASGLELDAVERVTVVTTGGGDAEFSLVNGPVDLGAFSYGLTKEGNDWHLDTEKKVISPGTRSVLALFNTAPTVWYGELSSLRTRMGELRYNEGKSGAWGRAYGSKYNVAESSGTAYKQTQQGFTLGADAQVGDSQWLVGVLAGHSKSDLDLSRGTTGTVDSYYAGAYTTWLDQDSGYYFDAVAKVNRFDNKSKVAMSDGSQAKGNYKTNGVGASAEFGRHIKLDDGYFVEPFAQVSAVSIQGASYDLDSGLKAEGDRTTSVLGKAGATVGRNFDLGEGRFAQPYLRAAAVHEFAKNNQVKVNDNVFNNDLSGSRAEVGAGIAVSLSERLQLHADIDYSNGDKIEKPFGANVGVRFTW